MISLVVKPIFDEDGLKLMQSYSLHYIAYFIAVECTRNTLVRRKTSGRRKTSCYDDDVDGDDDDDTKMTMMMTYQ